jgi:DNA transformation protein and related proteins
MPKRLTFLKGLGPTSAFQLKSIGIHTKADLLEQGAIPTYLKLKQLYKNISLNFLYAMVGALEDKHWREIAATRREELLLQIEGFKVLEAISPEEYEAEAKKQEPHENKLRSD